MGKCVIVFRNVIELLFMVFNCIFREIIMSDMVVWLRLRVSRQIKERLVRGEKGHICLKYLIFLAKRGKSLREYELCEIISASN